MALIVLPLRSGDPAVDQGVRDAVEEVLATLHHAGGGQLQPSVAVPQDADPWRARERLPLVDLGAVILHGDEGEAQSVGEALGQAFVEVLGHPASQPGGVSGDAAGEVQSVLHIVPVLALPGAVDDAAVAQGLARLAELPGWLEQAVRRLRGDAVGEGLHRPIVVFPWLFLPRLPAPSALPAVLHAAGSRVGRTWTFPIAHSAIGRQDQVRDWDGYGRTRLLGDLYALHALSASRAEVDRRFPLKPRADQLRRIYVAHSALVEFPLDEHMRRRGLSVLLRGHNDQGPVLPSVERLDELVSSQSQRVAERVARHQEPLRALVGSDVVSDRAFHFGGPDGLPGDPSFAFADLDGPLPRETRWQGRFDDAAWPVAGPARRAAALHDRAAEGLEERARKSLHQAIGQALDRTRAELDKRVAAVEADLSAELLAETGDPTWSPLAAGLGGALALLDGIAALVDAIEHEEVVAEQADAVLADFDALRDDWIRQEQTLLERGSLLPSRGAVELEVLAVGLVTLGLGGWLLSRRRRRELDAHFAAWVALGDGLQDQANQHAGRLAGVINARARSARRLAIHDLSSALSAARDRFEVEVQGLLTLVQDEHALLARKHGRRPSQAQAQRVGRFSVDPELPPLAQDAAALRLLREELARLLRGALSLSRMPDRVAVRDYQDVVERFVHEAGGRAVGGKSPDALVTDAARYGLDPMGVAGTTGYRQSLARDAGAVHLVFVGRHIDQRLVGFDWEAQLAPIAPRATVFRGSGSAAQDAVHLSTAPEIAVFLSLVPLAVDRSLGPVHDGPGPDGGSNG